MHLFLKSFCLVAIAPLLADVEEDAEIAKLKAESFFSLPVEVAEEPVEHVAPIELHNNPEVYEEGHQYVTSDEEEFENQPVKSPQEIQAELDEDERLFKEAYEMFNPWYAGPILTGGAHMMPPGAVGIQPYIFLTETYAVWDSDRKSHDIPTLWDLNPSVSGIQFGLASWLDMTFSFGGDVFWQKDVVAGGYDDTSIGVGFPILQEDVGTPAIKVVFNETFPTGKYQRLNPNKNGLDATGAGSFQSSFGLRIAKLFFWSKKHPFNWRAAYSYKIPSRVHVRGLSSYGGTKGTAGVVNPGNVQQFNMAGEYSFTQNWVFALDAVYVTKNSTKFHGTPGFTSTGAKARVGPHSSDQLSFAPAIEYNPTPDMNFLAGVWFDVYGRNTGKFVSYILSFAYTFSVSGSTY